MEIIIICIAIYSYHSFIFFFLDSAEIIQVRPNVQDADNYEYYVHYDGCKYSFKMIYFIYIYIKYVCNGNG